MIRAIGFDLDNTLFDHTKAAGIGIASLLSEKNWILPNSIDIYAEWHRLERFYFDKYLDGTYSLQEHRRQRMGSLISHAKVSASESELNILWDEYLTHYAESWIAYEDVHSTLTELKSLGFDLAVLTNGQQSQQVSKLLKLDVHNYFDFILGIGTMIKQKPHPEAFLQMAESFGYEPHEVLYVGDDLDVDFYAAQRAGLQSVWLNRNELPSPKQAVPQINSLIELPQMINLEKFGGIN